MLEDIRIKDTIKFSDEIFGDYRIVVNEFEKGGYVDFSLYEVDEQDINHMLEHGFETTTGELVFSAWISYKHIFPYYGREKESSGKYHVQLYDLESLKSWHDMIYNVCEMMMKEYEV